MRFDIVTLFPELFEPFLRTGVTSRAFESGQVQVKLWQLRDFAQGGYRRVDDRPFGGGPGMILLAEPLAQCVQAIQNERPQGRDAPVILFSPAGKPFTHECAQRWAASPGGILICGRYEGVDQRFIDSCVTEQISLGDFVLSGGEITALALLDAVARLHPGVLHGAQSSQFESFNPALDGLLDCPHYTRPQVWRGQSAPQTLLGGHHEQIQRWRREKSLSSSAAARPDLIAAARAAHALDARDEQFLRGLDLPGSS